MSNYVFATGFAIVALFIMALCFLGFIVSKAVAIICAAAIRAMKD